MCAFYRAPPRPGLGPKVPLFRSSAGTDGAAAVSTVESGLNGRWSHLTLPPLRTGTKCIVSMDTRCAVYGVAIVLPTHHRRVNP